MRLNNFRQPFPEEAVDLNVSDEKTNSKISPEQKTSSRGETPLGDNGSDNGAIDNFNIDEIPPKLILVDPRQNEDTNLIVYHSGKFPT